MSPTSDSKMTLDHWIAQYLCIQFRVGVIDDFESFSARMAIDYLFEVI